MSEWQLALRCIFWNVSVDWWRRLVHHLSYRPHGGSGLSWSRRDILDADADELIWHANAVTEARNSESRAIEEAQKKKG